MTEQNPTPLPPGLNEPVWEADEVAALQERLEAAVNGYAEQHEELLQVEARAEAAEERLRKIAEVAVVRGRCVFCAHPDDPADGTHTSTCPVAPESDPCPYIHDSVRERTTLGGEPLDAAIVDEHGAYVADVQWYGNAALIAAAPALLEALEGATDCIAETHYKCDIADDEGYCHVMAIDEHATIRTARAAIALARGEAVCS